MAWLILVISGVLEAVWATALGRSEGFTKLGPSVVFGVALVFSMAGDPRGHVDIARGDGTFISGGVDPRYNLGPGGYHTVQVLRSANPSPGSRVLGWAYAPW